MTNKKQVAEMYLLRGIQHWGQTDDERVRVAQAVIDAAGFNAQIGSYPYEKAIWTGPDAVEALAWFRTMNDTMRRGRFQDERDHILAAIEDRSKLPPVIAAGEK